MELEIWGPTEASMEGCENVLRSLPEWFGIEQTLVQYLKDIQNIIEVTGYVCASLLKVKCLYV